MKNFQEVAALAGGSAGISSRKKEKAIYQMADGLNQTKTNPSLFLPDIGWMIDVQ